MMADNKILKEADGLTYEEAIFEAKRCFNCVAKPCVKGCVAHMEIPAMIKAFLEGNGEEAKRISELKTSFPEICGRVCYQDVQCEAMCVRMKQNAPVKIGKIERYIGDHYASIIKQTTPLDKKVAVIGSGPSGLACAYELIQSGVKVTVYDKREVIGGVLKYGIPPYRLPNEIVDDRLHQLAQLGVEFVPCADFGTNHSFQSLLDEGYDAVFIAIGASQENFANIKGADHPMVIGWKSFLSILNIGETSFKKHFGHIKELVVVGGGNVAMDVVVSARKFGIKTDLVYRRTRELMPARKSEIEEMLHLGVTLHDLTDPVEITDEDGKLKIICKKTKVIQDPNTDRGIIVDAEGTEILTGDMFVMAIGSSVMKLDYTGLQIDESNRVIVDENYETSIPHVFAGGDAVTGTKTVINALASGKQAAIKILEKLSNQP